MTVITTTITHWLASKRLQRELQRQLNDTNKTQS